MSPVWRLVEAVLFLSDRPMFPEEIASVVGVDAEEVVKALEKLKMDYDGRSFSLVEYDGRYVLELDEEFGWIAEKMGRRELSEGALRTLAAIVDLGEPRPKDVAEIVGPGAYRYVKELKDRGYIRIEGSGRNRKIKLTKKVGDRLRLEKR